MKPPIPAGQPRLHSLLEAIANVLIGIGVAFASQLIVFPAVGVQASIDQNVKITVAFTAISLARSFLLRRLFNRWHRGIPPESVSIPIHQSESLK